MKKLKLNKQTISLLDSDKLKKIDGGAVTVTFKYCGPTDSQPGGNCDKPRPDGPGNTNMQDAGCAGFTRYENCG